MKNIIILGSGLIGCLSAYKIAKKYPQKKIYLIDSSKKILNGFDSIKIKNHKVNNGYHGIDVNRNLNLYNFFKTGSINFKYDFELNVPVQPIVGILFFLVNSRILFHSSFGIAKK